MNDTLSKITDTISIIFPAAIAVLGILGLTKVIPIAENVEQCLMIGMGAATSICSIWFNNINKQALRK